MGGRLGMALAAVAVLAACTPPPMAPERAADRCEAQARAAQGPTGRVTIGANSQTGGFFGGEIGVTSDFLAGRDPMAVYEQCVYRLTGQAPIRPPRLR